MSELPRVEFTIDSEDLKAGIKAIALVDEPAIESDFIFFNKQEKKKVFIKMADEDYKNMVFGAILIPEKDILRIDDDGNPYVGYFSSETIVELRDKFHKEMQTNNVNEMHEESAEVEAFLVESYIIDSEDRLSDAVSKGLEDIVIGSWIAQYKIEDDETFQKVVDGELAGFSIEAFLDKEFKKNNNNFNKEKSMKNKLIERLTSLVEEFSNDVVTDQVTLEEVEITLVRGVDADGIIYDYSEVGEPVMVVSISEETQEESMEPAAEGEYTFDDGSAIVVDAEGNLAEIKDAPAEEEAPAEDAPAEDAPAEEELAEEEVEVVAAEEGSDASKSIKDLVDLSQDGYYTIEFSVEGGEVAYGSLYTNQWKELDLKMEELEALKTELDALKKENVKLSETVLAKPAEQVVSKTVEVDLSKMSEYEKRCYKLGIDPK